MEKDNLGKDFAQTGLEPEVEGVRLWHIVRVVGQVLGRVRVVQFQRCTAIGVVVSAMYFCALEPAQF